MFKKSCALLFLFFVSFSASSTLLINEQFEGPNTFKYYSDSNTLVTIPNFVGPGFDNPYMDNKWVLAKETSGCHGGNQCIRIFGEYTGNTGDLWTNEIVSHPAEIWVTWWQKLSTTYDINIHHKWFEVQGDLNNDAYISFQSWAGATNPDLSSRLYNSGAWAPNGPTIFAQSDTILPLGTWYKWKMHIKLNSSGQRDGFYQVWIAKDGVNYEIYYDVNNSNQVRTGGFTNNIYALRFAGTRARADPVAEPESFGTMWIDDIKIGTTEADVDGAGGGAQPYPIPGALREIP